MPARNIMLNLGLLSIPAKLSKATESGESQTNLCVGQPGHEIHDPGPLTRPATCTHCGPILDYGVLKKGIKEGDTYAITDKAALDEAKAEFTSQYKDAMNFVAHPAHEFLSTTAPGKTLNYAIPAAKVECGAGCKGCPICRYHLLVRLVTENPDIAFVSLYTPVSVTSLYMLGVRNGALVLEERTRTQSLKMAPEIPQPAEFKDKLYAQLEGFLDVEPYEPDAYEDKYALRLREIAEQAELVVAITPEKTVRSVKMESDDDLLAKLALLKKAS